MNIFKPGDIVVSKENQMCKTTKTCILKNRIYEVLTTGVEDTEQLHGITLKNVTGNSLKRPVFKENLFRKATKSEIKYYLSETYGFPKFKLGDKVEALATIYIFGAQTTYMNYIIEKNEIYEIDSATYLNDGNRKNGKVIEINVKNKDGEISPPVSSLYFKKVEEVKTNSVMQDIKLEDVLPEKEKTSREKYHETMEKIFNTEAEIDQTKTKLEELKQIKFDLKKEEVDLLYQIREESRKK